MKRLLFFCLSNLFHQIHEGPKIFLSFRYFLSLSFDVQCYLRHLCPLHLGGQCAKEESSERQPGAVSGRITTPVPYTPNPYPHAKWPPTGRPSVIWIAFPPDLRQKKPSPILLQSFSDNWQNAFCLVREIHCQSYFNISLLRYKVFFPDAFMRCSFPVFVKYSMFCLVQPRMSAASATFTTPWTM